MTTVIYHKSDFDGIFCREIAKKYFGDKATYIGWEYGEPEPVIAPEDDLVMLDISVAGLMAHPKLVWIDHHKSAIEKYDGWVHEPSGKDSFGVNYNEFWRRGHETSTIKQSIISGYRIDGVAACRLAWQWFHRMGDVNGVLSFPRKEHFVDRIVSEPLAVRLAGEYDIWDKRDPNAELFQHGLRSRELTPEIWDDLLSGSKYGKGFLDELLEGGRSLQYAKTNENESIIKSSGFTLDFEGLNFLACNATRYNSFLFTAGLKPEHDALIGFNFDGKKWRVSMYHAPGKEHHDLSLIAVKHGGGGHRGACGFTCSQLPFSLTKE